MSEGSVEEANKEFEMEYGVAKMLAQVVSYHTLRWMITHVTETAEQECASTASVRRA